MTIPEIKTQLSIATVLAHYGLRADSNNKLCCPFHADDTPSLQVYPKTNTWHCFGCGKGADTIDFIGYKEGFDKLPKNETIHYSALKATELLGNVPVINKGTVSLKREGLTLELAQLNEVFPKMKSNLRQSKDAQAYLLQRGLDVNALEIGYNGRTYKDLKHCITFALRNAQGIISGMYGRSIYSPPAEGQGVGTNARHFYLKESTGLYPYYPKQNTLKLILTESVIDAGTLLQLPTITNNYSILACYGTNRLNDEIQNAIKALPKLEEIIFAFDNDDAGYKATEKYANELKVMNENLIISTLVLPNKDINETFINHNEEVFTHLLETRKTLHGNNSNTLQQISTQDTAYIIQQETPPNLAKRSHETFLNNTTNNQDLQSTTYSIKLHGPHLVFTTDVAVYTIKGGMDKVMHKLYITLEVKSSRLSQHYKLDLYDSKQVDKFIEEASKHHIIDTKLLISDVYLLTQSLDAHRLQSNTTTQQDDTPTYTLSAEEEQQALQLAQNPLLMQELQQKLTQVGIVGEDNNKVFLFAIACSHIQANPLNALIQGSSGSGKTNLLKSIYKLMPEERKKIFSRCSEKMLYNVPSYYFKNKLVCFEDVDGLGEEAEYAWRELVSNGELISGVSYKDEKGNIGIKELFVYGPITSLACTTHGAMYADNMSRLFLIAIDESKEQTQKINDYQAQEAAGLIDKAQQQQATQALQNYVRLLKPYEVHNPHATQLKLPQGIHDQRRLYRLYLYFVDMITVLHQYQRRKTTQGKLIATKQDCQLAKDLLFDCIMLKMDELDGSLRQFFERLKDYINAQDSVHYEFTQRELRTALHLKKTQLSYYVQELVQLEYIQHLSSHSNKGNRYKVLHFDDYKKIKANVKVYMQDIINALQDK